MGEIDEEMTYIKTVIVPNLKVSVENIRRLRESLERIRNQVP